MLLLPPSDWLPVSLRSGLAGLGAVQKLRLGSFRGQETLRLRDLAGVASNWLRGLPHALLVFLRLQQRKKNWMHSEVTFMPVQDLLCDLCLNLVAIPRTNTNDEE